MNDRTAILRAASREAAARTSGARERMLARASDEHLLDVALGEADSPIGRLLLAVTRRGLVTVAFDDEERDTVLERLAREVSPRIATAPEATDEVRRELDEYFTGQRRRFDLRVDRRLMHPFAKEVLIATGKVGYGRLATYGEIAARIGRPKAARAVGAALGSNPIPIVVPCHRIVGVGGRLTGYAGGLDRKERLLALEGSLLRTT
jgi:methylated-DNA-[protein]-cysteine S-methyltransferase